MYAPEAQDPCCAATCAALLDAHGVSAHYLVDRQGAVLECVDPSMRAWHAGASMMPFPDDMRANVNDFSVGIELLGEDHKPFDNKQYQALAKLIMDLSTRFPIRNIVGHQHVAPERKTDPGAFFDWGKLRSCIGTHFRFPVAL